MWREPASLSFSAIKLDVIRLSKVCEPDVFGLIRVEICPNNPKTCSTQAVDWSCMYGKLFMKGQNGVLHD